MPITGQGEVRPITADKFRLQPYFAEQPQAVTVPSKTKGQDIMDSLLIGQYQDKPILRRYFMAFVAEMDILYEQAEMVYQGRFIENARGVQLDIIGIILNQGRSVELGGLWFGFVGAPLARKMADEATPLDGGEFFDENLPGYAATPLNDIQYRRLLMAKAMVHSRHSIDVNLMYNSLIMLIGRAPYIMELRKTGPRQITLFINNDLSDGHEILIYYFSQYIVPLGTTFLVTRV